ncbi:MAG: hypothetical protein FJZ64_04810, partial [Chlamydiae bacterium]|nr:hypothetical protein [Chlamydiota bacterium]
MRWIFLFFLPILLMAQPPKQPEKQRIPPEQIAAELADAQTQFDHALELFNPWYTGPLITPSATMIPPGKAMIQPYIYFTDTYGAFDQNRDRVSAPNEFSINILPVILQVGVTPSVDTTIIMGTLAQWKNGQFGGGFQDIILQAGFKITGETLYVPKMKFSVSQSFPTGKYQNLDPEKLGIDGTGAGSWGTTFTYTIGKVFFW